MPLNTTNFLVSQGWEGVGVPLDGKAGKGLKKPLAITQKKTLSGIGKDRDRADDWWNSIFTAGAKSLSIGPSPASSGASTPTLDKSKASPSRTTWNMGERSAGSTTMSLSSLAKREHARKTLMSNFVRGKPIVPAIEPVDPPKTSSSASAKVKGAKVVAAADAEVNSALDVTPSALSPASSSKPESKAKSKSKDREVDAEKLARKLARKALRKQRKKDTSDDAETSSLSLSKKESIREVPREKKEKKEKEEKKEKKGKKSKADTAVSPEAIETASSSKKRKRDKDADADIKTKKIVKKDKKAKKDKKDRAEGKEKRDKKEKKTDNH
ncbi:hypothetical protein PHSY_007325 [Pseudozyma hubeiensis SY62]|uniref:G-patch domain-containing protein n=1 Tax=Pseudozyma hubeiensis (strain SY62) TaxID=1305764 RepID=R9PEN6_PSEHS|nr:hypothetical protein PHSY_007325 [Pseudozyma hubeiensis SY62]GAC99722.1 hypothetical protein PHSY_007325 [Pseudozyma hubeiensis SY62]